MIKEAIHKSEGTTRINGAMRGVLTAISPLGEAIVDFCGNVAGRDLAAISTVPFLREDIGREAILLFEDGDPSRPLLVGLVRPAAAPPGDAKKQIEVSIDGRRLALTAQEEISLRCGEASITLTSAGKVLIKGAYLLSKATGPNRIKGGSVQLN